MNSCSVCLPVCLSVRVSWSNYFVCFRPPPHFKQEGMDLQGWRTDTKVVKNIYPHDRHPPWVIAVLNPVWTTILK